MLGFSSDTEEKGARRSFVSGRNAVLILLAVTAVLMLALPAREYLRQRGEIHAAAITAQEEERKVDSLQKQLGQWQNPDYVREQARRRLHYVLPGEVGYVVLGANDAPPDINNSQPDKPVEQAPWYAQLWNSVQTADHDDSGTNHPAAPARSSH